MLYRALLATALVAVSAKAIGNDDAPSNRRKLSFTPILGYGPGSKVNDHARIDLDQGMIVSALSSTPPDYTKAKGAYSIGVYSKPSAVCSVTGTSTDIGVALKKSDTIYFETVAGTWTYGKASADTAATATGLTFSYPVEESQISYDFTAYSPTEPSTGACWVGQGTGLTPTATKMCLKNSQISATAATESTIYIGCTGGTAAGPQTTCTGTAPTAVKVKCTNRGKRTLAGFSTAAKKKMYDASMSSSDCPAPDPTKGYTHGCPYTSFKPFFEYYCKSTTSSCHASGDYANQIILAALDKTNGGSTFDYGKVDLSSAGDAERVQFIKKGTAYLSAWMYAIREFEDAIDDCVSGSNTNGGSSGPVHAWDEGVAFYVGSALATDFDMFSKKPGLLAYTLGNKRCVNFKTCGVGGDLDAKEQAKVNTDLMSLFTEGQQRLITGDCAGTVPIKNKIVDRMTIPLIQGTLRYAWMMSSTAAGGSAKSAAEGAIFAAGVLPVVHACDPAAAKTIDDNMNIANFYGAKKYDFNAVKAAFESCYTKMFPTISDVCKEVGGLWDGKAYFSATVGGKKLDATPCKSASSSSSSGLSTGALVGIIIAAAVAALLLVVLLCVFCKERAGKPIFAPIAEKSGSKA